MDKLLEIIGEIDIPSAYDHFAEGEAVDPPFITYLLPGTDNFAADGKVYYKINEVHIELYTDAKDPEVESIVEAELDEPTPRSCMRSCIHSKWRVKTWETKSNII